MAATIDRDDLPGIETPGAVPAGKLPPQPWMTTTATLSLFAALTADGAEARFVGGCVRDALANRPVSDIDIATTSTPDITVALLERAGIRAIPTGIAHGTITAITDKQTFEITTLREDVVTDGRRATVAYTDDWFADARRRDFTFNAMTATRDGDVYDPCNGIADLARGRVRFIGKARDRIAEDYLRILRFFRFQATHGRPPAGKDALGACRQAADQIVTLSGERVQGEMMRILRTVGVADTLLLMRGEGVLAQVLPEVEDVGRLQALVWLTTSAVKLNSVSLDPLRNLAAALPADKPADKIDASVDAIADRWKLSGKDRTRLKQMTIPLDMEPDATSNSIRTYLYIHGPGNLRDRALLQWATEVSRDARLPANRTAAWVNVMERADQWNPALAPIFPVNGEDVMALGITRGPKVGELLDDLKNWWCDGGFAADLDACLEHLEKIAANPG